MIINRIKLNYNIKLVDDYFKEKKYENIIQLLQSQQRSSIFYNLVQYVISKHLVQKDHMNFSPSKFVWISSYDLEDTTYLNSFLKFYLPQTLSQSSIVDHYQSLFSSTFEKLKIKNFPTQITFEEVVSSSYLHQLLISIHLNKDLIFANTQAAFFEAPQNKFLIFPQTTLCHFYIIRNPYKLYGKYKKTLQNSQEALNELNNTNDNSINHSSLQYTVHENRQNWGVNAKSWVNKNVQNTYRGKVIKYEAFINNPEDALTEVVYHLKQSGANIDVKFDLIEDFVKSNPLSEIESDEISNKEIKMVQGALDQSVMTEYDYAQ